MDNTFIKLILSLYLIFPFSLKSQKVIENPVYEYCSTGIHEIKKVELSDKDTRISFKATFLPYWWIKIPSDSYLTDKEDGSGRKYKIITTEGIELDKECPTPECGYQEYTLVFEALEEGTETVNYISSGWKLYGIDLTGKAAESKSFLPQELNGEWRTNDEYNEWKYGFYDRIAIINMDFWEYDYIKKNGKGYEVGLKKGEDKKILYLKKNKNGTAEIGDLKKGNPLYTTTKTEIFKHEDVEEKQFFRNENAVLRIYIDNYNHKYMDKTIPVLMNNYITNENIPGVAVISKHGTAEINIPLNHPLTIDIDYAKNNQTIYIEPGDTLLIKLDKKELFKKHTKPVKYYLNFNRPAYMGKQAYINRDILNLGNYKGEVSFYKNINSKDFSFEDYKTQYLNYYNKSIEYIDRRGDELQVSEISKRLAKNNFTGLYVSEILDYSQERNKVVNNEDFSFLSEFDFTDKYLISTDRFRILINRYEYINFRKYYTQYVDETKLINDFFKELDNKNIKYDPKYKDSLMCSISGSEIHSSLTIEEKEKAALAKENFIKQYNEVYKPLYDEANSKIDNSFKAKLKRRDNYYLDSLKVKKNILYNVMFSRQVARLEEDNFEENYKTLKQYIDNKDIIEVMDRYYNTKYKTKKYAKVKLPEGIAKDFFNSIIAPHKGKIVLVDFWSTSCRPCISGIEKMSELREKLKGKDISFVFITDKYSSALKRYEEIMKNVDGYKHYIEKDEMNHMRALFKFIGIPRYVLVDKDGDVIDTDFSIYPNKEFINDLENTFIQMIEAK